MAPSFDQWLPGSLRRLPTSCRPFPAVRVIALALVLAVFPLPPHANEEELAGRPETPLYRAFLPEEVDLRGRFPPAGRQGSQESCVGWVFALQPLFGHDSGR